MEVRFSIIIPTYKDWDNLRKCVASLTALDYPRDAYEVIIANNDPDPAMPTDLDLPHGFRIIHQPIPGSYAARNAALAVARGAYIAFTDADCSVDRYWLKNAEANFDHNGADRIAGKVEIFYQDDKKKTAVELYESIFAFDQEKNVRIYRASITANLLVKADAFRMVGTFDQTKKSGEDFGWNWRANEKGLSLAYADDVIVRHPARKHLREIAHKKRRVFGGKKKYNFKTVKGILKEFAYLPYLFYSIVWGGFKRIRRSHLTSSEKATVFGVVLYTYMAVVYEYFRLLFGGSPLR
jgi:glycosyltransferase involved in cell wall biosynthesis